LRVVDAGFPASTTRNDRAGRSAWLFVLIPSGGAGA
jgi:hypothetical protein